MSHCVGFVVAFSLDRRYDTQLSSHVKKVLHITAFARLALR